MMRLGTYTYKTLLCYLSEDFMHEIYRQVMNMGFPMSYYEGSSASVLFIYIPTLA